MTDLLHLELLTGIGPAPWWPRPVRMYATITYRKDPLRAVQRASRWASYSARVAVTPRARIGDRALVEAHARGVWLIGREEDTEILRVVSPGERGAAPGSKHGLAHRLLDELIWEALNTT
ncbi:hypothetical protein [Actinomadura sp. 3N407]|uniref:hypothetical protein n=1 Tax=Actinomadura sp. 3N407 TaxID=3457423 RepID=UPI003FCD9BFB